MYDSRGVLDVQYLGLCPYQTVWDLQRELHSALVRGESHTPHLLLCEHLPVITFGKSALPSSLLTTKEQLQEKNIEVLQVERGGDFTFHGPGQLVAYPILNLQNHKRDVHWYLRTLEEIVITVLAEYGLCGMRIPGRTGVWIETESELKKICSMG
ncbi:MAG: lipoyl(octanoyl) transferase LipB, partial [Bdellovibrionales bacterium]|nr:lipoyl(octanoyl) transferase LipB [Bdellovibrionales bacterium]